VGIEMKTKKWLYPLLITGLLFSSVSESLAAKWGTVISPAYDTNIRAKRSVNSKLKGLIKAGQPVKVDFLVDDWYAAFKVTEKRRSESKALGYVYAPSLHRLLPKAPEVSPEKKAPVIDKNLQVFQMDSVPIEIKNITFKTEKDGREFFIIDFNCPYVPAMYRIQGETPRVVLDITNVSSIKKELATMSMKGKLIKQIRSTVNPDAQIVRIVLYLEPSKDCSIHPFFNGEDSTYFIEITEENKRSSS
jgi:hypothetical protein